MSEGGKAYERVSLTLTKPLSESLGTLAEKLQVSRQQVLRALLRRFLSENGSVEELRNYL